MASMVASACEALSCGARGVCDPIFGLCVCQAGWVGAQCDELAHPACSLGPQKIEPLLQIPCAGLRKISPVACECIASCLRADEEVCGHGSMGCNMPWKDGVTLTAESSRYRNLTTRHGFQELLPCFAHPPGDIRQGGARA